MDRYPPTGAAGTGSNEPADVDVVAVVAAVVAAAVAEEEVVAVSRIWIANLPTFPVTHRWRRVTAF
jgi:uncharacterized protein (DUF2062 family)